MSSSVEQQQHDVADQAEFLGVHREDEVGVALGDEIEVRLRAVQPALAGDAAGADRDGRLDGVVAGAERVLRRVEQREHALALVVVQQRPQRAAGSPTPSDAEAADDAPAEAGEEDDEEAGRADQHRGAEVGLAHDQRHRHASSIAGHDEVAQPQRRLVAVEVPRQHQRHRDLHHLRGLDARDADVQPAPRAVHDLAEQRHARRAAQAERRRPGSAKRISVCGGICANTHIAASATHEVA